MNFLKKLLIAVGLIILLAILKIVLAKLFPSSLIFHYNLLSCLQLFLFCWAIITGIGEFFLQKKFSDKKSRSISFLFFILLITVAEFFCFFILYHPAHIPKKLLPTFSYYYNNYQRNILQYNKKISVYDTSVFYKMIPDNKSVFANVEFSDSISTNSVGFRDDDESLQNKKIICLGDSYTLGWGVHAQETYPQLLKNILHTDVLNTGMSSYGTAREVASVRNMEMKDVENIIIQYSYNDEDENDDYVKHNDHLKISPRTVYDSTCNTLAWSNLYFPGKYFFTIGKLFLKSEVDNLKNRFINRNKKSEIETDAAHYKKMAKDFVEVIKNAGWNFDKLHVYVFDICEYDAMNDKFINALNNELLVTDNKDFFKNNVHPLYISSLLKKEDYYLLDGHVRASGQKKIAEMLSEILMKKN